jgi:hypothetical protein
MPVGGEIRRAVSARREKGGEGPLAMMSRSVSFLTLKGMFLMTMAVGMISSSPRAPMGGVAMPGGGAIMWPMGGGEPLEERSELLCGESERWSAICTPSAIQDWAISARSASSGGRGSARCDSRWAGRCGRAAGS